MSVIWVKPVSVVEAGQRPDLPGVCAILLGKDDQSYGVWPARGRLAHYQPPSVYTAHALRLVTPEGGSNIHTSLL